MRCLTVVALVFAVGCGGSVEGSSIGTPEPAGTSSSPEPSPSSSATEAPPSLPPPPTADAPAKVGDPPSTASSAKPFHLVVANRSGASLAMGFTLDGVPVVKGAFAGRTTYAFDFALDPGSHAMHVDVAASGLSMATSEAFAFETTGERWGAVDVSTVRCDPCSTAVLGWQLLETPPPTK